jgi:hypothetical protein
MKINEPLPQESAMPSRKTNGIGTNNHVFYSGTLDKLSARPPGVVNLFDHTADPDGVAQADNAFVEARNSQIIPQKT